MKITDLAAGVMMIDLPRPTLDEADRAHLAAHPWGGLLIFARNVENREQLTGLIGEIGPGPLLAIDQEGGLVDRIRFESTVLTPGPMALAATGQPEATREAHRLMALQLRQLGFHLDFSPCVDVNTNPDNPIIGVRSFGENPTLVGEHGAAACLGLREGGTAATIKHFPGHGDCRLDSHLMLPTLEHSEERLRQVELAPFQRCIDAGAEAVMTAHITYPALDTLPATLSSAVLQGLLREQLGFEGVIFTDSMEMRAIADTYGLAEASILALLAGADMIICGGTYAAQVEAVAAVAGAVESGRLPLARLQDAAERVRTLRDRFAGPGPEVPSFEAMQSTMRELVEQSITLVKNQAELLPLRSGRVLLLSPDLLPVSPLGEMTRSESTLEALKLPGVEVSEAFYPAETRGPALEHLLSQAREVDAVVFTVYARHRLPDGIREFGERLLESQPRTVMVSLSSPYVLRDLPAAPAFVCTYNYTPLSLAALGRVLTGELLPQGRLPVSIPGCAEEGVSLRYQDASSRH